MHLTAIRSTFSFAKFALGIPKLNHWKGKCVFLFELCNLIFCEISLIWSFYVEKNVELKFFFGVIAVGAIFPTVVFINNVAAFHKYEKLIKFCEDLHFNPDIKACENVWNTSKKFKFLVMFLPCFFAGFYASFPVIMWFVFGKWMSALPLSIPFVTTMESSLHATIFNLNLPIVAFLFSLNTGIVIGIILVMMKHFQIIISTLREYLHEMTQRTSCTSQEKFDDTIRKLVLLHCQLLDQQEEMKILFRLNLLLLEGLCFLALLFLWIVMFFIPDALVVAIITNGNSIPHFTVCWINECLRDTHEDLKITLHDVDWYNMTISQKKSLLFVMLVVQSPAKLLTAGQFHQISYESMGEMMKKIYTFGMVTNNVISEKI